jgi:hypothetical protein
MRKYLRPILYVSFVVLLVVAVVLIARQPKTVATPTATFTPDPCTPANISPLVDGIHALMREFYDASALASETPSDQLATVIPSLQELRRRSQDQDVPSCLVHLKTLQIDYMNSVIDTMMVFMNGGDPDTLINGVVQARSLNEEYRREMARLLGVTYEPPAQPQETKTPVATTKATATP